MATEAITAEGSPSESPATTISGADLLRAAELMDQQSDSYDDNDLSAQEDAALAEASGDRAPVDSGAETKEKDKAEPSAEDKKPKEEELDTGPPRDEKGRFLPKDKSEQEPTPEPAVEDSKYSKAKKEEERQRNLLANFEKDKAQFRAEQEQIRRELQQQQAEIAKFRQLPRKQDGSPLEFTSEQYGKAATDFYARARAAMKEGDFEAADKHLAQAEQLNATAEQAWQAEQQYTQQSAWKQHETAWVQAKDTLIAKEPDLQWNQENPTPLNREIDSILSAQGNEFLFHLPHGFSIAAQVARWKLGAAEASALSEKLTAAEAEVERLQRLTGVRPAPSSGMPRAKTAGDMSHEELGTWLQEQARIADAA